MTARGIFFDVDDTLLHFTREYDQILADALRSVVGECRQQWLDSFDDVFHERLLNCKPAPYRSALDSLGLSADTADLVDALREHETRSLEPPARVHTDLERLRSEYRVGVLTNGVPEWQRQKLRAYELEEYFEVVVTAYDAGAHKPSPVAFATAEDALPATDYALVGDSAADYEGAADAGWSAHRYDGGDFAALLDELDWG